MIGTSSEMLKPGAESIRTLVEQVREFEKSAEVKNQARSIMQDLIDAGLVPKDAVLKKLAELENASLEDLKVMQKALEMGTLSGHFKLAEISDTTETEGMTPQEKFVFNTLGIK